MTSRKFILALGAAGILASTSMPVAAQVGDFFCSTLSIGCEPPPPPPPPAPVVEEPVVKKKVRHAKAKPKRTAAPKTAETTTTGDPQQK